MTQLSDTCQKIFDNSVLSQLKRFPDLSNQLVGLFSSLFIIENNVHLASIAFVFVPQFLFLFQDT